jgi:hypothetical protein
MNSDLELIGKVGGLDKGIPLLRQLTDFIQQPDPIPEIKAVGGLVRYHGVGALGQHALR